MPFFDEYDDPNRGRLRQILEQIGTGRIADVSEDALQWFCGEVDRLDRRHARLTARLKDALREITEPQLRAGTTP